jgi:hypothetical protein
MTERTMTEQKMIDTLAMHGIEAKDLVPALMTTHTVANPEYDPAEARKQSQIRQAEELRAAEEDSEDLSISQESLTPIDPNPPSHPPVPPPKQPTAKVLEDTSMAPLPGVSKHLSAADEKVTLDIRWTVLCDLFLILVADSVYDARSRVLLENVAIKLGLGWLDVVKFERRVTEALDIQEEVENLEAKGTIEEVKKNSKKRRYLMLGLATLGTSISCSPYHESDISRDICTLNCRWRTRNWAFSRASRTCHWRWTWRRFHDYWDHWYYWLSRWRGWGSSYYYWRCSHRVGDCCARYGKADTVCSDI